MATAQAAGGRRRHNLRKLAPAGGGREQKSTNAAFESFYRDHVADVYQYALAVLTNPADAEDVTQQTFLNAYRAFERGERPNTPHNWLIKIAHNVCRMRWRQSSRRPQEVPLEHASEPAALDDEAPPLDAVLRALARLPFNQRAAIVMREVEDRSYAEIAEVLGTTVPAVEALLFRARTHLRARRKSLGVLTAAPLPGSLSSFIGGSGGGVVAAGGAALGTELVLKAAAVVATGVVAGGLGFKTVQAVATSKPPKLPQPAQRQYDAQLAWVNPVERLAPRGAARDVRGGAGLNHPGRLLAGAGSARKVAMGDQPAAAVPGAAEQRGAPSEGGAAAAPGGGAAASGGGGSAAAPSLPATTVNTVVGVLPGVTTPTTPTIPPPPVTVPPPPTLPPVSVTVPTVTVPTVTAPTVTLPPPPSPLK